MKKIYFYNFIAGFVLGFLALFVSIKSSLVANIVNRLGNMFFPNSDIGGFIVILIYLTVLVLPLVVVFFLITSILWRLVPGFKNKYLFSVVLKANALFIMGVLVSVLVVFLLSLMVVGA